MCNFGVLYMKSYLKIKVQYVSKSKKSLNKLYDMKEVCVTTFGKFPIPFSLPCLFLQQQLRTKIGRRRRRRLFPGGRPPGSWHFRIISIARRENKWPGRKWPLDSCALPGRFSYLLVLISVLVQPLQDGEQDRQGGGRCRQGNETSQERAAGTGEKEWMNNTNVFFSNLDTQTMWE